MRIVLMSRELSSYDLRQASQRTRTFFLALASYVLYKYLTIPPARDPEEFRHIEGNEQLRQKKQEFRQKEIEKYGLEKAERSHKARDSAMTIVEKEQAIMKSGNTEDLPQGWFIPLGLAFQLPHTYYKGSDPEWQEFIKFSQDSQRVEKVKRDLAAILGDAANRDKQFQLKFGSPLNVHRYWLDMDYPDGPPPRYMRFGLFISDHATFTYRPVTPWNYFRFYQALSPTPLAKSLYAGHDALVSHQLKKLKGLILPGPNSEQKRGMGVQFGASDSNRASEGDLHATTSTQRSLSPPSTESSSQRASTGASDGREALRNSSDGIILPIPSASIIPEGLKVEMKPGVSAFKKQLVRSWRPASDQSSSGCIMVTGLVEIAGPHAVAVFDVKGHFNPKVDQYEHVSANMRRYQRRSQPPKGGA
ncbi:MAG: hypothetical protein M1824_006597 [Vezdaea acicularis]|nr:MAG: hypothetical protein M1824_006597 [Vezdaea acicularis]